MQRFEIMGKGVIVTFMGSHDCGICPAQAKCDRRRHCNENKAAYLLEDIPGSPHDFAFLRGEMERQGYTIRTFAAEIGMRASTLCEKMSGKVDWKLKEMNRIASALGGTIDVLFQQ